MGAIALYECYRAPIGFIGSIADISRWFSALALCKTISEGGRIDDRPGYASMLPALCRGEEIFAWDAEMPISSNCLRSVL